MKKSNRKSNRKSNTKSRKRQQTASKRRVSNKKTKRTIKNRRKSSHKSRKQQKSKSIRIKKKIKQKNMRGGEPITVQKIFETYKKMIDDNIQIVAYPKGHKAAMTDNIHRNSNRGKYSIYIQEYENRVTKEVIQAVLNIENYLLSQNYYLDKTGYINGVVPPFQFKSSILLIDFQNLNYKINGNGSSVNYHNTTNWIEENLLVSIIPEFRKHYRSSIPEVGTCFVVLPGGKLPEYKRVGNTDLFYIYVDCKSEFRDNKGLHLLECWESDAKGGYGFNESDDYVLLYIYTIISYNLKKLPVRILSADKYDWYNYTDPSTKAPIPLRYFNLNGYSGYRQPINYWSQFGIQT